MAGRGGNVSRSARSGRCPISLLRGPSHLGHLAVKSGITFPSTSSTSPLGCPMDTSKGACLKLSPCLFPETCSPPPPPPLSCPHCVTGNSTLPAAQAQQQASLTPLPSIPTGSFCKSCWCCPQTIQNPLPWLRTWCKSPSPLSLSSG